MTLLPRPHACALVLACFALAVGGTGCALRATTDFGPQTPNATRTLSAGPQGLPGEISGTSGPDGDSVGVREGMGNTLDDAGVSGSTNNGAGGSGGAR